MINNLGIYNIYMIDKQYKELSSNPSIKTKKLVLYNFAKFFINFLSNTNTTKYTEN